MSKFDIESEVGRDGGFSEDDDVEDSEPFDIVRTKGAPAERLRRWQQAALVLNASRRFRYTLDLKKEAERNQLQAKIRAHAQVIRAAARFHLAVQDVDVSGSLKKQPPSPTQTDDFDIRQEELSQMSREHNFSTLQQYGGVKGIAQKLKTNLEKGIHGDETDLLKRKNGFGSNTYPRKKGQSFWRFLWEACQDTTLIILMVAAAASLALDINTEGIKRGWYDGGSIALAVFFVTIVTAINDYWQSLQFQTLSEEKQNIYLEVVRCGRRVKVSIFDIVVGDIVPLKIGDQIPADGILVSGYSLAVDESSMTGESKIVHKDSQAPFFISGSKLAVGYGTMMVTNVGINTGWGMLMASISEDNVEETPLQVRLNSIATYIGKVGLVVASVVLIALFVRYFIGHTYNPDGSVQFIYGKTKVGIAFDDAIKIFTVTVALVIVVVPEGLPLAFTLTLAHSIKKMMTDKALVRRHSACETMGFATTICCDKTGILTLNQMTVVEAYVCGKKVDPPDNKSLVPPKLTSLVMEGIAQNFTGSLFLPEGGGDADVFGSSTEKAILQWGLNLGMNFDVTRSNSSIIHAFPFNSEKKRVGVAVKLPNSEVHVHWKGAAEIVLASCASYMNENDDVQPIEEKVSDFKIAIEDMAARSLRCVAIAYQPHQTEGLPNNEELWNWQLPESQLILLAIVGIKDTCRLGVGDAVQLCIGAGIKVRMITGDDLNAARAFALECGILGSDADATEPNLIEGKAFRAMSENQRLEVAEKISVMGRSTPADKLALVRALRTMGHVVVVTGDGTNDASALHETDIGLAMGIQGTEVAKESSDIVILDDNFASIVKAVIWGRTIYDNIQKFIQFLLTVNIIAVVINIVTAVSAVCTGNMPLNAVQLLWVNLIMDTLGAVALATEPPTDNLMNRPPVSQREPLITNIMWRNIMIQALYQVPVLLLLNFRGKSILDFDHDNAHNANDVNNTLVFNASILCEIFNLLNARKPDEINVFKGVSKNYLFMGVVGLASVVQVIIIFFLGKFTSNVRLSWKLWLVSFVIAFISWPLAAIGKLIPVPDISLGKLLTQKIRLIEGKIRRLCRSAYHTLREREGEGLGWSSDGGDWVMV
ncbi:hypothetical protein ACH5RR_039890 [Cinchona calisaya]|uniref:Calcium-transporting ATPase n=1 Tax=Cinchona calisaya TaxID=153742 RepID=A0ABD2Y2Y0_9GENT